jgi:RNA polymerase sigma-70 factor (ECF subfamily)
MTDSRERLLIEAAQKDPSRFAELYDEHFHRVYSYIARRVRERHEAQDLTSEVFRLALASLPKFEWRGVPIAAWLFRIAANEIADHHKRVSRERTSSSPPPEVGPDESEGIERRATLFRLVEQLPLDQRRVIVMRFAEERSVREIAETIGRSEGAVKQLQWRGLEKLRAQMGRTNG